jgi:hypothetical protein
MSTLSTVHSMHMHNCTHSMLLVGEISNQDLKEKRHYLFWLLVCQSSIGYPVDKGTIFYSCQYPILSTRKMQVPTEKTLPYSEFEPVTFGYQVGIATN